MKEVVQTFVEGVIQMYLVKAERGQVPASDLFEFVELLRAIDWSVEERQVSAASTIPGLRHLQNAIVAAYADGPCPIVDALRLCVGVTPWETYYADSNWSRPFLDEFASGELVGPSGFISNQKVSIGLFLLGPNTVYTEHAHASNEVYYLLGGEAIWRIGDPENVRQAHPGDLIYTAPHQRHDIQTGSTPMLAVFNWKADPSAPSYHFTEGPWRGGSIIRPPLVNRA